MPHDTRSRAPPSFLHLSGTPWILPLAATFAGRAAAPAALRRRLLLHSAPTPSLSSRPSRATATASRPACKPGSPPPVRRRRRGKATPLSLPPRPRPARQPPAGRRTRWRYCWRRPRSSSGSWSWLTGSRGRALRLPRWRPEKLFASSTEVAAACWAATDPRRRSCSALANRTETCAPAANERTPCSGRWPFISVLQCLTKCGIPPLWDGCGDAKIQKK